MKSSIVILFLVFTTFSVAQQSPNSIFNYKKSTDALVSPNSLKFSLNIDSFKLEDLNKNAYSIPKLLQESYNQRLKPSDNMPIFSPEGKFFLKIYEVDEDIDYKLRNFHLEKSKYFWKTVG